ncbi:MAG: hypothetical protein JJU45_19550, partial [Acidimicrobiia bacterium]|nr:hypothetical protein [Acidimicrobiia bacterium]
QRHAKRVEAGEHLQRFMAERLHRTPPETSGAVIEVGSVAGLTVTGQAITTIDDEIRIAVPDAHIEVTWSALDWKRSDPSGLITRLERQIQRLPETLASLRTEGDTARAEADRAAARIGTPWDRTHELSALRRRQGEINDTLATAMAVDEPPSTDHPAASASVAPVVPRSTGRGLSL